MALVMVITTVALMAMLIVAIFSMTRSEYKSTNSFVAGRSAKQLGDEAVAIVQAQIQNGHYDPVGNPDEYTMASKAFHATQPGMVRVYNANGTFRAAYKLYSSSTMKVSGSSESALLSGDHQAPEDWSTLPARFVDLNEPVVRAGLASGTAAIYFPVIDPRAAWNYTGDQTSAGTQVEGFSYADKTSNGISYADAVVRPDEASGNPARLRLPMPVEWMYVLQDGSTGTLNASNEFVGVGGVVPSVSNPIVGRIAFWTDDESCKININTASEPTFMGSPFYYHERDRHWAHFPAASGEYQRYPGHPATVALSSVLAPNLSLDPLSPSSGMSKDNILAVKEYIYDMAPKLAGGGSRAGTLPFALDDFSSNNGETGVAEMIDASEVRSERLYASVDEMIFKDRAFDSTRGRQPARYVMPGAAGRELFDRDTLEHSRFFLTAHSRAPEFTIFGLPRICMWPVDAEESQSNSRRTTFDNIIALCASMRGSTSSASVAKSYIFRRSQAHHPTHDVNGQGTGGAPGLRLVQAEGLTRNSKLLDYLSTQMSSLEWPRLDSTGGTTTNFSTKYGSDNVNQLAIQFFDYIRCTNLYDGILARGNDGRFGYDVASGNAFGGSQRYKLRDDNRGKANTFTEQRLTPPARSLTGTANEKDLSDQAGVTPGHGQVTPAVWSKGGRDYRGFGRMFTLSEIGIQFICTADGLNDSYALEFGQGRIKSGGGTAIRVDPGADVQGGSPSQSQKSNWATEYPGMTQPLSPPDTSARWYSNFPPLTTDVLQYGTVADPSHPEWHPSKHLGYNPFNWNLTLEANTPLSDGTAGKPAEKRIQAIFLLEAFCPSLGWTKFFPEWTIVLDGEYIKGITVGGQKLFDTDGDVVIKSDGNIYEVQDVYSIGGHAGPSSFAGGRHARSGGGMLGSDRLFDANNPSGHNGLTSFALTSRFLTVPRDNTMKLSFPSGALKIRLYDTHYWESVKNTPAQTFNIRLSDATTVDVPTPGLVGAMDNPFSAPYPYLNITTDSYGRKRYTRSLQGPHYWVYNSRGCLGQMGGRVNPNYPEGGLWLVTPFPLPDDAADSRITQAIRGRLDTGAGAFQEPTGATANGFGIIPDEVSDVTRTFVPTMGDYRIIAAMADAPTSYWMPHPSWNGSTKTLRQIHSFTNYRGNSVPGSRLAAKYDDSTPRSYTANPDLQLVHGATYNKSGTTDANIQPDNGQYNRLQPDLPGHPDWAKAAQSFGDFDTGLSNAREGPYINKPDEGNYFAGYDTRYNNKKYYRSAYFFEAYENTDDWRSGIYMTPNRLVSSPVMFGSLPSQVWAGGMSFGANSPTQGTSVGTGTYKPWQTLLFRPHSKYSQVPNSRTKHPGEYNPKDHLLLDMFFMPVVEPYAISEPMSVAGRVNMNYQIMPFTHITRATGMHAVMKGEFITAMHNEQIHKGKEFKRSNDGAVWDQFWDEKNDGMNWHRPIDVAETLRQFEERFNHTSGVNLQAQGLFRTASQICELYLIPQKKTGTKTVNPGTITSPASRKTQMDLFWQAHRATGDNVRERPYSNLYSRLTTRSNTFRVHVRAQVLRKTRSTLPTVFDPNKDAVVSEYRGSTLIERYIDPNNAASIPDYADVPDPLTQKPLESFYRFRTLETKRFSP